MTTNPTTATVATECGLCELPSARIPNGHFFDLALSARSGMQMPMHGLIAIDIGEEVYAVVRDEDRTPHLSRCTGERQITDQITGRVYPITSVLRGENGRKFKIGGNDYWTLVVPEGGEEPTFARC